MDINNRKNFLFIVLAGFFVTNAITAELIGGKLIQVGFFVQSIGIILWPIVFLLTDIINEHYGRQGVVKLSLLTVFLISYVFLLLFLGMQIPAFHNSPVNDVNFKAVFGQSMYIIVGSILAFIISQILDATVFHLVRKKTQGRFIWLRATVSTLVSQLIDTFVVQGVAFVIPGYWTWSEFVRNASMGYTFKIAVALLLIPLVYLSHYLVNQYLQKEPVVIEN